MLAAALRAEVDAYVDAHTDEVDENGSTGGAGNWRTAARQRQPVIRLF